jgi:hypothetical protein
VAESQNRTVFGTVSAPDILTRLMQSSADCDAVGNCDICDAAVEIERLRAQVAELKDAKHWLNEDLLRMRSNFERAQAELEWVRRGS